MKIYLKNPIQIFLPILEERLGVSRSSEEASLQHNFRSTQQELAASMRETTEAVKAIKMANTKINRLNRKNKSLKRIAAWLVAGTLGVSGFVGYKLSEHAHKPTKRISYTQNQDDLSFVSPEAREAVLNYSGLVEKQNSFADLVTQQDESSLYYASTELITKHSREIAISYINLVKQKIAESLKVNNYENIAFVLNQNHKMLVQNNDIEQCTDAYTLGAFQNSSLKNPLLIIEELRNFMGTPYLAEELKLGNPQKVTEKNSIQFANLLIEMCDSSADLKSVMIAQKDGKFTDIPLEKKQDDLER